MWSTDELLAEALEGRVAERFDGIDDIEQYGMDDLRTGAEQVLARPQAIERAPGAKPLGRRLLAAQWTLLLEHVRLPDEPVVLEPCAGGSDPVVVALDVLFGRRATYYTVNLNRELAAELLERTAHLDIEVQIIGDDARNISAHFRDATFDCVCFHHAVNDIIQTAVAATHGMDTRDVDWWPTERQMIEWMGEQHEQDGLESVGLPELRAILESAARAAKPGGPMCFDHWTWAYHLTLDWFPGALFNGLIPLARQVALSLDEPLEETTPEGLDGQWWMVLRRETQV